MTKLLSASLIALLAISTALPVVLALATPAAAARCSTDKPCNPDDPNDPGDPGKPPGDGGGDDGGDGPGSPGDPFIPPDFTTADIVKNMLIACRVAGTPEDLPNDLKFRNIGDITIPAGTRVYWIISETQDHGYFVLPQDLPVGKSVNDLDVLPQGLPTDDHCLSKIM
jgi:hypothetical protein